MRSVRDNVRFNDDDGEDDDAAAAVEVVVVVVVAGPDGSAPAAAWSDDGEEVEDEHALRSSPIEAVFDEGREWSGLRREMAADTDS
jgi:hypothetical protein